MDQKQRDLMEEVKAIIAEGAEANQSVVKEQPSVEPKAETKEANPDTKAEDNKTQENNETKGDIAGILKTTADANGDWSVSAEKPNWSYTYKAEVTSVDEAGNTHDYAPTTFYIPMESISVAPTDHL